MPDALILAGALAAQLLGCSWLALSMEVHWRQACGAARLTAQRIRWLRLLAAVCLAAALPLCAAADHASIAILVWFMGLAAAALAVTFCLSWRPRWLRPLAGKIRGQEKPSADFADSRG